MAAVEATDRDGTRRLTGGKRSTCGVPQGGVVNPMLANRYMNRFLRHWRQRGRGEAYQARVVNYADDFVILSRGHAAPALAWTRHIMTRLGLTVNEAKTCIRDARQERFDFLGSLSVPIGTARMATGTWVRARLARASNA